MSVEWVEGALPGAPPASAAVVVATCRELGFFLPDDFLDVAQTRQGVRPVPSDFERAGGWVDSVEHLLHFEEGFANILGRRWLLEDVEPPTTVPFAEVLGGDLLCFDFAADPDAPTVVFWSVGTGAVPVADSFTAFVGLLHEA